MNIEAIIEVPKNSHIKYELKDNVLIADRELSIPMPHNYGYIPHTLSDDGDPLDVFVISQYPILPGARVKAKIIGGLVCVDNGFRDDKIITVMDQNLLGAMRSIEHFLMNYKTGFNILNSISAEEAFFLYQSTINLDFPDDK